MPFNLIQEPWIPVRRKSNKHIKIRPSQITEDYETDPIVVIDASRADFNGAITQFLIGLIQTTLSPQNSKEWRNRFDRPPKPSDLQVNVESVAHAFNLDGDGPRFM